jgi:hypothetical protein
MQKFIEKQLKKNAFFKNDYTCRDTRICNNILFCLRSMRYPSFVNVMANIVYFRAYSASAHHVLHESPLNIDQI